MKLGQDFNVALSNLTYRVEAGDLPFFTTAIMIQRETGGNLAEVLDNLGKLIRDRFALYGKVRALTAIGRASANPAGGDAAGDRGPALGPVAGTAAATTWSRSSPPFRAT